MKVYPYATPIILDDSVFVEYGGQTGTTTSAMRKAAYQVAEMQMTTHIDTFLLPTTVTGTWNYDTHGNTSLATEYGYVNELLWVRVLDHSGKELRVLDGAYHNWAAIREDTYGYVFVDQCVQSYNVTSMPYIFQAAYVCGLPTGTANQPPMLLALTMAAQLTLNEMLIVPANETTGDAGVEEYKSLDYSEKRKKWSNSAFGASASAAKIAQLVNSTIKKARRSVMLGRM